MCENGPCPTSKLPVQAPTDTMYYYTQLQSLHFTVSVNVHHSADYH